MKSKKTIDSTRFNKIVVSVPRPKSILLPFEVKEDRRDNTTGPLLISLRSSVAPSVIELTSIPLECRPDKLELTRNRVRFELDTSNMLVNPSLLSPKNDSLVSVINTEKPKWVSFIMMLMSKWRNSCKMWVVTFLGEKILWFVNSNKLKNNS